MKLTGSHIAKCILCTLLAAVPFSAAAQEENQEAQAPAEFTPSEIVPSRSVTLKKNQNLDIVYPGSGWIYLGETSGSTLLRYAGRKLSADTTSFTLLAQENGSAVLHFFKNDALTGKYIEDYLEVSIEGSSAVANHVTAPSYADVIPPRPTFNAAVASGTQAAQPQKDKETSPQAAVQEQESRKEAPVQAVAQNSGAKDAASTVIQNTDSAEEAAAPVAESRTAPAAKESGSSSCSTAAATAKEDTASLSSDDILALAQKAYDAKDYPLSLSYLADFLDKAVTRVDEGLYLQARALEAPSASRDIKQSISVYRKVVEQFPESPLWETANARIVYLDRFYFAIR
ncbi:MAG: hypothetical protein II187_06540 [Treponema sp.]|nr:hypothetical protein [Treponema sp.]